MASVPCWSQAQVAGGNFQMQMVESEVLAQSITGAFTILARGSNQIN